MRERDPEPAAGQEPGAGGTVHPGRPPRLQRIGRGAAVVCVLGFLGALAFLTARYPHGGRRPGEEEPRAKAPSLTAPLSAERIEEYARERLEQELRARRPAPPPPELELPLGSDPYLDLPEPSWQAPVVAPPPPAPAPAMPRQLPALRSPLSPSGGRSSRAAREAPPVPEPPLWEALERGFPAAWGPGPRRGQRWDGGSAPPPPEGSGPAPPPALEARAVELPPRGVHLLERLEPPARLGVLGAGTVVPLVITHDVVTDVAGPVRAWVARDVFDSVTHRTVLIPRGTLVIGSQSARTAPGDRRVLIAWRTLRLPSGVSYVLPDLPAGSSDGTAGARGDVDHHWWSRFGNAAALSLVGAASQLSQPQQRTAVQGFAPSEGQIVAQQLGLELGRLSQEILRRGLDRAPTIHLPAGHRLTLLLTQDLAFPPSTSR